MIIQFLFFFLNTLAYVSGIGGWVDDAIDDPSGR